MAKSKTDEMLDWALSQYEKEGSEWFACIKSYKRAAAQHFSSQWFYKGYNITLRPPHLIDGGPYRFKVVLLCESCKGEGFVWASFEDKIAHSCQKCKGTGEALRTVKNS